MIEGSGRNSYPPNPYRCFPDTIISKRNLFMKTSIRSTIPPLNSIVTICLLVAGIGCAGPSLKPAVRPVETFSTGETRSWWYVRFKIDWPEGREPSWHVDPMLARELIRPVLFQHKEQIDLWRFHRRAVRDKAGHQFSFIFYASQDTAARINATIQSSKRLEGLLAAGVLVTVRYDDPTGLPRPGMADTSDRNWSQPLQRTWPYFIMGVSRSWLELVSALAEQTPDVSSPDTVSNLQTFYAEVNQKINQTWKNEGNHAYFHHLNAVYGYQPLYVWEKTLRTF